jgi:hypothetical protein
MFPAVAAVLGLLHVITRQMLGRGLKFQTCMTILNNFLTIPGIFAPPLIHHMLLILSITV